MKVTKEKFLELYNHKSENNEWDYKKELSINTKDGKYNIVKDFLAFANYGGGYILIGVDEENNYALINVKEKIDPAVLGDVIESNLGFNIKFEIKYFRIESKTVGLIYIYPSSKFLISSRTLHNSKNKVIIRKGVVLTRRNTQSTNADSDDIQKINLRINNEDKKNVINDKPSVFLDNIQEVKNLWNALNNEYILNAETISIILRGILFYSKYTITDFIKLTGIEPDRLDNLLNGDELPQLEELVRISSLFDIDFNLFFQPNIAGVVPFWKDDLVRYSIMKLITPISDLTKIKDVDKFFGSVVYSTANNIYLLHLMLSNKVEMNNRDLMFDEKIFQSYKDLPEVSKDSFFAEFSRQYYKLLEQIIVKKKQSKFTVQEEIILLWNSYSANYLARIFTESIKRIKIIDSENYKIVFHFWDELKKGKIRGRSYDNKNIKLVFSKVRFEI